MDPQFWLARWSRGEIGFHEAQVNRHLQARWPALGVQAGGTVLVPLCGKSLDMLWLHAQGHPVVGVELSAAACDAFFAEHGLAVRIEPAPFGQRYVGQGQAEGLTLLCGDLFTVTAADLGPVAGLYDRAALIALPPDLRRAYARHLAELVPAGAAGLLIALDYPQPERNGPPFAVPEAEVHDLLDVAFEVRHLECEDLLSKPDAAERRWGLSRLHNDVYALRRR